MPLKELGSRIQTARQAKGMSIEDVALKLKVHRHTLRSIEEGNLEDMPEPVYARSFTRAYAAYVGIAPEVVQEAVDQVFPLEKTPEYTDKTDRSAPYIRPHRRSSLKSPWLALVVLIILVAAGAWYYMTYMRAPSSATPPAVQGESAPSSPTPAPPAEDSEPPGPTINSGTPASPASAPQTRGSTANDAPPQAGAPAAPQAPPFSTATPGPSSTPNVNGQAAGPAPAQASTQPRQPEAPTAPVAPQQTAQAPQTRPETSPSAPQNQENRQPAPPRGEHLLVINALEPAWFSIMVDGVQRSYNFQKGDSAEFTFKRQATLRMGNAGGVTIVYNGTPVPKAGERGEVRTLVFPPSAQ